MNQNKPPHKPDGAGAKSAAATSSPDLSQNLSRYIMIGGFLGAGKTTVVARLAQFLHERKQRVGLITNDQGSQLVDTAMLRSRGFATEEISGGCFCCRFNSLVDAAKNLSAETRPDVFIAEPVGSCTDLVATVSYPLRRIYGDNFLIAPLSVLVDPVRARRIFGLEEGAKFSDKVLYIYRKQLEEADFIVINKSDLLDEAKLAELRGKLRDEFPRAEIFAISARSGAGLESWFENILASEQSRGAAMTVNYETYADGEALLGWLNATVRVTANNEFDGNKLVQDLAGAMEQKLKRAGGEIAHLKMTLDPDEGFGDITVINLVRNDGVAELSQQLHEPLAAGELIINLRAELAPAELRIAVEEALKEMSAERGEISLELKHLEHFRPGKPQPTHRMVAC